MLVPWSTSNTGIIKIGEDKLFIAKQATTGFPGTGGIKTEALKEEPDIKCYFSRNCENGYYELKRLE
jgi:hypothetical protein